MGVRPYDHSTKIMAGVNGLSTTCTAGHISRVRPQDTAYLANALDRNLTDALVQFDLRFVAMVLVQFAHGRVQLEREQHAVDHPDAHESALLGHA